MKRFFTSTATFDTEVKDMENRKAWFAEHNGRYVIYVDVEGRQGGGICVAFPVTGTARHLTLRWRYRFMYTRIIEGRGIGRSLMEKVLAYAAECDEIDTVISLITSQNAASIHLHEVYGFEYCGQIKNAGTKFEENSV